MIDSEAGVLTAEEAATLEATIKTVRGHLSRIAGHVRRGIPHHGAIECKGAIRELTELRGLLNSAQERIDDHEAAQRAAATERRRQLEADPEWVARRKREVEAYIEGMKCGEHVR